MPRSQPQAGNAYGEALPRLLALLAAPTPFPGGTTAPEILEEFWLKLTPMAGCPPHKNFIEIWYANYRIVSLSSAVD
ncbi:hypothetical protein SAMD00079811_48300 [Scytonema sp. HK-05]|uniref:hypothetical protein n=1 Tax=Scytonema sp. HK-05 TaxID=1137095 RepID=UPI000936B4B9|nr:hypothetical protein [Scytonema sp. HK-05]OKH49831.1 hypothetical protein NIES2130_34580 [Scytonema sp. HK-05]BAY47213.1 hypothetical protein SAMD00079811_48300 [Scytonema sp. HK-05]